MMDDCVHSNFQPPIIIGWDMQHGWKECGDTKAQLDPANQRFVNSPISRCWGPKAEPPPSHFYTPLAGSVWRFMQTLLTANGT
jgi:hypothetical protein